MTAEPRSPLHTEDMESESEPESKETDPLTGLHSEVDEVTGKMQNNLKAIMKRGILLSNLEEKSGNLKEGANIFKTTSKTLEKDRRRKDKLYWCLQCYTVMIIIQGIGLIAAILAMVILIIKFARKDTR